MSSRRLPQGLRRRSCLIAALPWLAGGTLADTPMQQELRRAEALRDEVSQVQSGGRLAGISRMAYSVAPTDAGAPR